MVKAPYVPETGHLIKIDFDPGAGHEQAGWRPAIVLSPASYNRPTGLAIVAPITNKRKGYPFETALPAGLKVTGVVLSDAIKNLDWRARNASFICALPPATMTEVLQKLNTLIALLAP